MAVTLETMRNMIAAALKDPSFTAVLASSVDSYINRSLRYYKKRRYWFNETLTIITLNTGSQLVPNVPIDLLYELPTGGLSIKDDESFYPLDKVQTAVFDTENIGGNGMPYIYTYRNNAYEIYYLPQEQYQLYLRYIKDYADLINNNDTNDFLTLAEDMVLYNALSRIYGELIIDPAQESYYTARANDEEQNLLKRSNHLSGTGSLTVTSMLC